MPLVFCAADASSSHCSGVLAMSLFSSRRPSEYYARIKPMRASLPSRAFHFAAALGIVLAITFVYQKALGVNATTVALTFLLAILVVSTVWGLAVSVFMSIAATRSEEHTSELQSPCNLVCRLLLEKKKSS